VRIAANGWQSSVLPTTRPGIEARLSSLRSSKLERGRAVAGQWRRAFGNSRGGPGNPAGRAARKRGWPRSQTSFIIEGAPGPRFWDLGGHCGKLDGNAPRPFWQARCYDFSVHTHDKHVEKLRYMHRNPVVRGLVERPEHWPWSSYRHYLTGATRGRDRVGMDRSASRRAAPQGIRA